MLLHAVSKPLRDANASCSTISSPASALPCDGCDWSWSRFTGHHPAFAVDAMEAAGRSGWALAAACVVWILGRRTPGSWIAAHGADGWIRACGSLRARPERLARRV